MRVGEVRFLLRSVVVAATGLLLFAASASASTINVETLADPGDGSQCTLRDAITAANSHAVSGDCPAGAVGADVITVTPTGTIQLDSALPQIQSALTITGPLAGSPGSLTVSGEGLNDPYSVFDVHIFDAESAAIPAPRPVVTITDLTITNSIRGVQNGGILTLNDVTVSGNSVTVAGAGDALAFGAGINQCPCGDGSSLTLNRSRVTGNSVTAATTAGSFSGAQGAAISGGGYPVNIDESTISGNTATASGGAVWARARAAIFVLEANATITRSTISGNTTSASGGAANLVNGGGIDFEAYDSPALAWSLDRDTVTGNTAAGGLGGGIYVYAPGFGNKNASVKGSTIAGNTADSGANVYFDATGLTFKNTIIANPTGSTNCVRGGIGNFTSLGYNLDSGLLGNASSTDTCLQGGATGDQASTNPALGPLQDNGGPTRTMAPGINSPAVDKGIAASASEDQRGFARTFDMNPSNAPGGDGSDIGAVEQQIVLTPPTTMAFGAKQWGTMTTDSAFLQNRTGNNLTPGSLALGGANPGDFPLNGDNCSNGTMINNQVCGVNVVFFPTSAGNGARSATLSFPTDVAPTQSLALTGSATEYVSIAPTPHDFGSTQTGTPTGATQFVVTNAGPGTSGTFATTLTGANASEFQVTADTCDGQALAGSATCAVSVRFAPASSGAKSATLNVTGAPGGTSSAALTGTATTPSTPSPTPPPAAVGPTGQRAAALKKCKKKKGAARKKCKKKANRLPV